MDWITSTIGAGFSDAGSFVLESLPTKWPDGGFVAAILIALVTLGYKVVSELLGEEFKKWLQEEKWRLFLVCIYGLLVAFAMSAHFWALSMALACAAAFSLFGPMRQRLTAKRGLWLQVLVLLLVFIGEDYIHNARNAGQRYLVLLAIDVTAGGLEDPQVLSQRYLGEYRAVFGNLPSLRVVPDKYETLAQEHLTSRQDSFTQLQKYVMQRIGRSRFCPALLVTNTADLTDYPEIRIHSHIIGMPPDSYERTLADISLEGTDWRFIGVKSSIWLITTFQKLRCDKSLRSLTAGETDTTTELMLPPQETKKALHESLIVFRRLLVDTTSESDPLRADVDKAIKQLSVDIGTISVDKAIQQLSVDIGTINALLDRYSPPEVTAEQTRKARCAYGAKLDVPCKDTT